MLSVNLICVGKVKEKYIIMGIDEFTKRLQSFTKFSLIELKEDGNDSNRDESIKKESILIKNCLEKSKGYNILLDVKGKEYSSEDMSREIEKLTVNGVSTINFIIGGSYGVSDEIKASANIRLSFSKMTFPHQLMRLIFIEQLYRWFTITNNIKYHK
ncbi:MAG: 23S rRNA (pseudouridine(1915)-N(3))-methyltransferase RlmH [Fusobacteriaceae bacterium]|nr:23S rRNA (pseudouridine(1915)-N(3))-methyltransferase RlmH [Fusobacteriaceae bacterium]MBP6466730.1 23S rRNA (pseudouridine(1915)-N(3))-methyltransferase RlmH [Fusobacteriaceae bacterium]MBU9917233.1 23S rRNA (pseudouridine(1915)-N(3))-methyltransferase RlmH [Fusobacteriaceae bacterium]